MLDYKLLEALASVIQEGGFERAARALYITQSAVSQRVKLLEDRTGCILLTRSSPPQPTPDGRRLIRHYRQVRRLEEDLTAEIDPSTQGGQPVLRIGVNADSLALWFMDALLPFVQVEGALMDLAVDDQERTHRLLKNGEVLGCISARSAPMQGCTATRLGIMRYSLLATPDFVARWFPQGLTREAACRAPAVRFNRADDLQDMVYAQLFADPPTDYPTHFVPSPEQFMVMAAAGLACGMTPHIQAETLLNAGELVSVAASTEVPVVLYWHRWNLRSPLLDRLSAALVTAACETLEP